MCSHRLTVLTGAPSGERGECAHHDRVLRPRPGGVRPPGSAAVLPERALPRAGRRHPGDAAASLPAGAYTGESLVNGQSLKLINIRKAVSIRFKSSGELRNPIVPSMNAVYVLGAGDGWALNSPMFLGSSS